jgi:hypothetical protein
MSATIPAPTVNAMLTKAAALVTGVLVTAALTGCGLTFKEFSDDRTEEAAGITGVRFEGGSGNLTLRRDEGRQIQIHRKVRYAGDKPGATDHRDGSALVISTECGSNCSVDYTITVPTGTNVNGHNGSGDVSLTGVAAVALDVGSGNVTVRDASGSVAARTGSGNIELTDVAGNVTANTGSGNVKLTRITGDIVAATSSGDVNGSELNGTKTSARTGSGNVTLSVAKPQGVFADPAGSYLLDLHSGSGNISVNKS